MRNDLKKWISTALVCCIALVAGAQQMKAVLPYELVGGKLIVELELNGVKKRMIFDTGAFANMVAPALAQELGLQETSRRSVTDVNNRKQEYSMTTVSRITVPGTSVSFTGFQALLSATNPMECYAAEGLIGGEMLSKLIVEIDPRAKTITLMSAEKQPAASLRVSRPFVKGGPVPLIGVDFNEQSLTALFDTGFGGFMQVNATDWKALSQRVKPLAETVAAGSIGLSGQATSEKAYRVAAGLIRVNTCQFREAIVTTGNSPYTLVGTKLLKYGRVTIDYPRQRFYFEPFEREVQLPPPANDFSMTVKDGELHIVNVWSTMKAPIAAGDRVTHINGQPVGTLDFCESVTRGIPALQRKTKNRLTVATAAGIVKVVYINVKP